MCVCVRFSQIFPPSFPWWQMDSPIANLVQQGTSLRPDMTIQHDDLHEDPEQAIQQTMQVRDSHLVAPLPKSILIE